MVVVPIEQVMVVQEDLEEEVVLVPVESTVAPSRLLRYILEEWKEKGGFLEALDHRGLMPQDVLAISLQEEEEEAQVLGELYL